MIHAVRPVRIHVFDDGFDHEEVFFPGNEMDQVLFVGIPSTKRIATEEASLLRSRVETFTYKLERYLSRMSAGWISVGDGKWRQAKTWRTFGELDTEQGIVSKLQL